MAAERRHALAVGIDTFAVVLFVAIGRRSHDEGSALSATIETALPFLIGLAVAWVLVRAWRHPLAIRVGLAIWPITVLVGMIARRTLFDRGTATSFVIVATLVLGALLVGWRVGARQLLGRRPSPARLGIR
ncbi:MAG: DUF3054 domain-containing protein [Ilumatobacter sp.]|uniref:DUF3054 domain-containing protein n=1 Tax=Ilumatobacter sp. TaxID=1967498 RepID=UPI00260A8AE2|nr:DUF3054 domain-containing protein [Ilumatobacter sp.]MDJ0769948.1 DUF3054 domain-containing protein [Ilumatobacter sp.]